MTNTNRRVLLKSRPQGEPTPANFDIVDALRGVAEDVGRSMAEVALAWVVTRPGVSSVLIGASRVEQLRQNIASLELELTPGQLDRLDQASRLPTLNPYFIFDLPARMIFGVESVQRWR